MACIGYMASFSVVTLCLGFASRQSSHHLLGLRRLHRIVASRACRCLSSRRRSSSRRSGPPVFFQGIESQFLFSPNRKHLFLRKLRVFCFPYAFMSLNPHPTKKRPSALNLSSYYTSTFHLGPIPGIQSCTCAYTQMIRSIGRMMVGSVHICYLSKDVDFGAGLTLKIVKGSTTFWHVNLASIYTRLERLGANKSLQESASLETWDVPRCSKIFWVPFQNCKNIY